MHSPPTRVQREALHDIANLPMLSQRSQRRKEETAAQQDDRDAVKRARASQSVDRESVDDAELKTLPSDKSYIALCAIKERNQNYTVGAACFEPTNAALSLLGQTFAWSGDLAYVVQLVLMQVAPHYILVSSKADESFVDAVRAAVCEAYSLPGAGPSAVDTAQCDDVDDADQLHDDETSAGGTLLPEVVTVPSKTFEVRGSLGRLQATSLSTAAHSSSAMETFSVHEARIATVDVENTASLMAAEAVVAFAQRHGLMKGALGNVSMFSLEDFMLMDRCTMRALDVVREEEHPSVIRGRGRQKEGFSLLTLLDRTRSRFGYATLRRWLLRPLTSVSEIEARHAAVEFLLLPDNHEGVVRIERYMKDVKDTSRALLRLKMCRARLADWYALAQSLSAIELVLHERYTLWLVLTRARPFRR